LDGVGHSAAAAPGPAHQQDRRRDRTGRGEAHQDQRTHPAELAARSPAHRRAWPARHVRIKGTNGPAPFVVLPGSVLRATITERRPAPRVPRVEPGVRVPYRAWSNSALCGAVRGVLAARSQRWASRLEVVRRALTGHDPRP